MATHSRSRNGDCGSRRRLPGDINYASNVPRSLDAFFEKGFAKNPDERYQSGNELAEALSLACSENS